MTKKTLTNRQLYVIREALRLSARYAEEQLDEAAFMSPDLKAAWERTLKIINEVYSELDPKK